MRLPRGAERCSAGRRKLRFRVCARCGGRAGACLRLPLGAELCSAGRRKLRFRQPPGGVPNSRWLAEQAQTGKPEVCPTVRPNPHLIRSPDLIN